MTTPPLDTLKRQCQALTSTKRYAEALKVAQQMLQVDENDIGIHRLLALLYGLNNRHEDAHMHYMLLVQFDPTYTHSHGLLVAEGYAAKNEFKAAGLICMAAAQRFKDKKISQIAANYFDKAGEKTLAEQMLKFV